MNLTLVVNMFSDPLILLGPFLCFSFPSKCRAKVKNDTKNTKKKKKKQTNKQISLTFHPQKNKTTSAQALE